jgi:hypothetical protein
MATVLLSVPLFGADMAQLQRDFDQPPDDSRIMMRWWWFGPAVSQSELEREMKLMKSGGIGGFEVQPTYPLSLDNEPAGIKNLKFMSPEFLDALAFTAAKAKELGLRMNLTLGSGWPYGGPQFTASEAAGRLRTLAVPIGPGQSHAPMPKVREGEKVFAAFVGPMSPVDAGHNPFKELEIRDDAAWLPPELAGQTQVTFFVASQTGMKVKRAAYGAEGFVIDHYRPAAIEKFIREIAEPEVQACGPNPPESVFCDSLEVTGADWTYSFLDEFQKRRGYDLKPRLPALFHDVGPTTPHIRHDWGQTLTELFNDHFITVLQKWAKAHETRFRIQAYGSPPAALHSYASAGMDEGEGYQWKSFSDTRWASSASHLLGRAVTSSETWTWLHSPAFMATPLDMKAEANLHFLQGINQLSGHGWPYSPPTVDYPGWRFYAAGAFNEQNPWWIVMPDLAKYLQRVSFLLRQGRPANDVALYLANDDAWASFTPGHVAMDAAVAQRLGPDIIRRILESGYNFDFFDDGLLDLRGRVEGNSLAFGDVRFKAVVLAGVECLPPSTLRKLEEFARGGGILIATRSIPSRAPGFKATAEDQKTIRDIAQRLFQGPEAKGIFVEDESRLGEALAKRLRPDVAFSSNAPEIGFVHRTTDSAEIYYLANTANEPQSIQATFRVQGTTPEWWDPMTGRVGVADVIERPSGGTTVAVALEPYGSRILVFARRSHPARAIAKTVAVLPAPLDLSKDWNVFFGTNQTPVVMETLRSWTDDDATRFFSGTAVYEKRVTVPSEMVQNGFTLHLDFGVSQPVSAEGRGLRASLEAPVREAAIVYVNGKRAGVVWCPPYRVEVTGFIKSGENQFRIAVANLAVNDMAGHPLPDYRELEKRYGNRFQPQDMDQIKPVTAGLVGSVRLIATGQATQP